MCLVALLATPAYAQGVPDHESALWRSCSFNNRYRSPTINCDCYVPKLTLGMSLPALSLAIVEAQSDLHERTYGEEHRNAPLNKQADRKLSEEVAVYALANKRNYRSELKNPDYMAAGDEIDARAKLAAEACKRESVDIAPRRPYHVVPQR